MINTRSDKATNVGEVDPDLYAKYVRDEMVV